MQSYRKLHLFNINAVTSQDYLHPSYKLNVPDPCEVLEMYGQILIKRAHVGSESVSVMKASI